MTPTTELAGKILIAMPDMGDSRFDRSVILLCAHSEEGAMGLIVNLPTDEVTLADLADQLDLDMEEDQSDMPVYSGGPVEQERGFVLHSSEYSSAISTMPVTEDICLTGTLDILEDLSEGTGPDVAMVFLGYCGWGPGQLEAEIAQNAWLIGDAPMRLIFATPDAAKWEAALKNEKISALSLSSASGRA
ncbi:YqgE/AlgH family protein [Pseudooceanicola sp. C21-150M6]|uniref:YqgE/AlgH family protein n=1 Tax=Pseudooceanicola sp. C21-150M6 TaxID=3434355 RepID=UPI003D7FB56A